MLQKHHPWLVGMDFHRPIGTVANSLLSPGQSFMSFYVDYKKLLTSCELPEQSEQSENLPRMTTNPHRMHYYLGVMAY
jgi:hypothetical protein